MVVTGLPKILKNRPIPFALFWLNSASLIIAIELQNALNDRVENHVNSSIRLVEDNCNWKDLTNACMGNQWIGRWVDG